MPRFQLTILSVLTLALLTPAGEPSAAHLVGAEDIRQRLGLTAYRGIGAIEDLKIAVLDYGFGGIDGKRPYLPRNAVLVEHYDEDFVRRFGLGDPAYRKPFTPLNNHGRVMAQLIWAMTGSKPEGPRFYLLNAGGPTLFRRAVRYAIEQKVDLILFSGHFEGAGNYDGAGFINAAVTEAVDAGILWINAAGNTGGQVYDGRVRVGRDDYLIFDSARDARGLSFRNRLDENTVTITLTWNDYREDEDAGTDKDLDLFVEDGEGKVIGSSTLRQVTREARTGPGESKNPRERVVLADLGATTDRDYLIRIKKKSGTFGPADRIRVLVAGSRNLPVVDPKTGKSSEPLAFLDASRRGEIYPPADHAAVITVGSTARSSSIGPTADGRTKPDVYLSESRARFSNGEETAGSSVAAAYFAGVTAVLKAARPTLRPAQLLALTRQAVVRAARDDNPHPVSLNARTRERVVAAPPLTLNEARALAHARAALEARRAMGLPPGGVYVTRSRPDGSVVRMTADQALQETADLIAERPVPRPPEPRSASGDTSERNVPTWRTPTPRQLAEMVP